MYVSLDLTVITLTVSLSRGFLNLLTGDSQVELLLRDFDVFPSSPLGFIILPKFLVS